MTLYLFNFETIQGSEIRNGGFGLCLSIECIEKTRGNKPCRVLSLLTDEDIILARLDFGTTIMSEGRMREFGSRPEQYLELTDVAVRTMRLLTCSFGHMREFQRFEEQLAAEIKV
jgi:hypothetical protein